MTLPFALDPAQAAPLGVALAFGGALLVLLGTRYLLLRRLRGWAAGTENRVDDLVLAAVHTPSLFWCVAGALEVALRTSALDPDLRVLFTRAITVLVIASMTLVGAHVAGGVVTLALRRNAEDRVSGLGQAVVKGVVLVLGVMVVLNVLGVEIAPLLTALGVGGLAVALALQDTLSNFFAGLHILIERPYTIGNFIRLENGQEGHVVDIGWRTTRVRTQADDVIVIPNSKMAGSTILNFHLSVRRSRVEVAVPVDYASDLEHVRTVLLEVAREAVTELDFLVADPPPDVLVTRFGDFAVELLVRFQVSDIALEPRAQDEMHRRVFRRLKREGIQIPFPVRRVLIERE